MHLQLALDHSNTFTLLKQTSRDQTYEENRDMASRVAALILLGVVCLGLAAAEIPIDCCLAVGSKPMRGTKFVSYSIQVAGKGCDIDATVFITKEGKQLCLVPAKDHQWVRRIIAILDARAKTQ